LRFAEDHLPTFDLKAYARRGAEARIAELTAELNDIYKALPDLRRGATTPSAAMTGAGGQRRQRKPMVSCAAEGSGPADEGVLGSEESEEGTLSPHQGNEKSNKGICRRHTRRG
jgi:hypothetical protein